MRFFLFFALLVVSCSSQNEDWIFSKDEKLNYNFVCSEEENKVRGQIQSYGFFESFSSEHKVLALLSVALGWVTSEDISLFRQSVVLSIEKFRIYQLEEWSGNNFSLSLRMVNVETNRVIDGESVLVYFEGPLDSENFSERSFQVSTQGIFEYESLVESEDLYRYTEPIHIDQSRIQNLNSEHQLFLVLRNVFSRREIVLEGPTLSNIGDLSLSIEKPVEVNPGTLSSLNPFQEGSLIHSLTSESRYRSCSQYQDEFKEEFENLFKMADS